MIIKYKIISIICNNNFGKRRYKLKYSVVIKNVAEIIQYMTENRIPTSIFSKTYFEMLSMSSCKIVDKPRNRVLEAKPIDQVIIVLI